MRISSKDFDYNGTIPAKFTCKGDINPSLEFEDVPDGTKSLALIVDDPDAPKGNWTHWVVWNIDPATRQIEENSIPRGAMEGMTSSGTSGYAGPCPPSGTHHYHFKLYALDAPLDLPPTADKSQLGRTMINHVITQTDLVGVCSHT